MSASPTLRALHRNRPRRRNGGIGAETGTIEPGKSADLIVTVENPLEDLRALRKVEMVVTQGRKIDHPQVKINPVVAAELDQFLVE